MYVVAAVAVAIVTFFVTNLIGSSLMSMVGLPEFLGLPLALGLATVAARATARAGADGGAMAGRVVTGALLGGTIGFVLGFFGPMILAPGANQGPLLGLFVTGPGGVVLGAIGAALWPRAAVDRAMPPAR